MRNAIRILRKTLKLYSASITKDTRHNLRPYTIILHCYSIPISKENQPPYDMTQIRNTKKNI